MCIIFHLQLGAIHKGRPAKIRISRPSLPLRPDKTIESHSNNPPRGQPNVLCEWPLNYKFL